MAITDLVSPMSRETAAKWVDADPSLKPTLHTFVSALKGVENKSLHEIHGFMDVSTALSILAEINQGNATINQDDFTAAVREIDAGVAGLEYGSFTDTVRSDQLMEEIDPWCSESKRHLIELGIAIGQLSEREELSVTRLLDYELEPDTIDELKKNHRTTNPINLLIEYINAQA